MISQSETAIFRALKRTAIILLLIYRLDKPVGRDEIADILELDPRTVNHHLNSLMRYGLITRTHYQKGYILSQSGRQMILGQNSQDLAHLHVALHQESAGPLKVHEPAQALLQADNQDEEKIKKGTICADTQFVLKEEVKEEVYLDSISSSLTTLTSLSSNCCMAKILALTPMLFGEPGVLIDSLPERRVEIVLGWLAQAYQQRKQLRSPAALVYSQLKKGSQPGESYFKHPELYLPFDFLLAIGWKIDTGPQNLKLPEVEDKTADDPSLDILIDKRHTARQAWRFVLDQLASEVPKPNFDTWMARTRPLRWSDNCLVIGAQSAYACDWLEDRLTSKITRLLCGILGRTVAVKFEVGG